MWGCFLPIGIYLRSGMVFPTHVGVFPALPRPQARQRRLPHACGGVSVSRLMPSRSLMSSPRMWGCFRIESVQDDYAAVFPTHVGVFLRPACASVPRICLPHACGGVSARGHPGKLLRRSSPRMWGCFHFPRLRLPSAPVFPTHVGVFPTVGIEVRADGSLPHACGGVSNGKSGREKE